MNVANAVSVSKGNEGWPALQIQLIQEMVGTARRMGNFEMAVSHMVLLLEGMFQFLTKSELTDISRQLEVLVTKCKDTNSTQLKNVGTGKYNVPSLTPSNLQKIPTITAFNLCPLPSHLLPRLKFVDKNPQESVFVFTPKQFGGEKANKGAKVIIFLNNSSMLSKILWHNCILLIE